MLIYHYTDRDSARAAIAARALRAAPVAVYNTLFGAFTGPPRVLGAAVWFTASETPSQTVLVRLALEGVRVSDPGEIWRFAAADDTATDDLPAWAEARGHGPDLFHWMVATARIVGENYEDWRLSSVDVPRERWSAVESLHGDRWIPEAY